MDNIKDEKEFKIQLMRCVKYMTEQNSTELEMDIGKVTIILYLKEK